MRQAIIGVLGGILYFVLMGLALVPAARAQGVEGHPFVGIVRVCVQTPEHPQTACFALLSRALYQTHDECAAAMRDLVPTFGRRLHEAHPDWGIDAQGFCEVQSSADVT